jgi:DNA repair photolyase
VKSDSATLWPNSASAGEADTELLRLPAPDFVLQRSRESSQIQSWNLDLGKGRPRDYLFCQERMRPADSASYCPQISLFKSVSERLAAELAWRQPLPTLVQIGAMLDPFHDIDELRHETVITVKLLAERRIISWLVTRGEIDGRVAEQLQNYRDWIRIVLAIASQNKDIQKVLEPCAASFEQRLDSFRRLNEKGIRSEIILEPMVPNLTDTHEQLEELLDHLANAGVTQITASYLVLRPEAKSAMTAALEPPGWSELALSAYADGVRVRKGPLAPAILLSKARRQRGYALLMALAAQVGISVRLSSRSNPDFGSTAVR